MTAESLHEELVASLRYVDGHSDTLGLFADAGSSHGRPPHSQSSVVRVYAEGEIRAEIVPELFLLSRDQLFTQSPAVTQVPEAGITLAVSESA